MIIKSNCTTNSDVMEQRLHRTPFLPLLLYKILYKVTTNDQVCGTTLAFVPLSDEQKNLLGHSLGCSSLLSLQSTFPSHFCSTDILILPSFASQLNLKLQFKGFYFRKVEIKYNEQKMQKIGKIVKSTMPLKNQCQAQN